MKTKVPNANYKIHKMYKSLQWKLNLIHALLLLICKRNNCFKNKQFHLHFHGKEISVWFNCAHIETFLFKYYLDQQGHAKVILVYVKLAGLPPTPSMTGELTSPPLRIPMIGELAFPQLNISVRKELALPKLYL